MSAPRLTDGSDGFSTEKHYSVGELAQLWALSEKTIRRMFENEPGVLRWGSEETRFKQTPLVHNTRSDRPEGLGKGEADPPPIGK